MILNPTEIGAWRSLVARLLWEQEVGGSNPLAPTSLSNSFMEIYQNITLCVLKGENG
jgi:hypothetical protein